MIVSQEKVKISAAVDVYNHVKKIFGKCDEISQDQEHFWVMSLNSNNVIKFVDLIGIGSIRQVYISPVEVFRRAIINGAAAIILTHNHPSGRVVPSPEDEKFTRTISELSKLMEIKFLDHVIIGDGFYSFAHDGKI